MQIDGPRCSCGNRGCLEALASRWALERDIRQAVKNKEKTIITKLTGNDLSVIKSKTIHQALREKDPLTTRLMTRIAVILGQASINLRHIFDPDIILFGGGLIEACSDFIIPRIKQAVKHDPFFGPISKCTIVAASLADNATILGAVALVRMKIDLVPSSALSTPPLPNDAKTVVIKGQTHTKDVYIRANGSIKARGKKAMKTPELLSIEEAKKICRKKTERLIIGLKKNKLLRIAPEAKRFLKERRITLISLPWAESLQRYQQNTQHTALLLRLT